MNINSVLSYGAELLWSESIFLNTRQMEVSEKGNPSESTLAALYEFQLKVRIKTLDNLVQQSKPGEPGRIVSPDLSVLFFGEDAEKGFDPADAAALIGEDGFFGVSKTAARIAEFVLAGAGDNLEKLRASREGVLRGFKEAEQMWGGKLPDISYDSIEKALEAVDERIEALGGSIVSYRV